MFVTFFFSFMYCIIIRFALKNYSLFCKEINPKKVPENRKSPFGIPTKGFKSSRNVYQTVFPFLYFCFPRKPSKLFSFFFFLFLAFVSSVQFVVLSVCLVIWY